MDELDWQVDMELRLADLVCRLDQFLDIFIEHTADRKEVEVFQTDQILKCRAEQMMVDRKTPRRRLNEVEQQVVNMNRFYQERIAELTHTLNEVKKQVKSGRKSKYD